MRSVTRTLGLSSAAMGLTALTALLGSGAAGAAPTGGDSLYAPSALVLSVTDGDDATGGTVLRAVTLVCAPLPGGTHPAPEAACAELQAHAPELDALAEPRPDAACTREWSPMTVTAEGVWEGRRMTYSYTHANPCALWNSTGTLFSF
ncbi:subtilase-type protease inhibitor [Streptomyces sp. NBC_01264]|uniref:subtilase-type protease inhibitor n=1 Tax=Streptomyces sp. NBC_01264 TaxID=2903804 RepID=UPI00224CE2F8|nr:subtilase-type protease inhibitor [Streptomyces sp. NBC_01264]MCX4776322.1 subtilase-type protease inhibitor [Streptomyces sp. NBC_01264]